MNKIKTKSQVQRRNLLKASAGLSVMQASSLGLGLGLGLSNHAIANNHSAIKRIVFVYVPFGAPLGSHLFNNGELQEGCEPLEAHKDNLVFFENCDTKASNFSTKNILGSAAIGTTLDVALGNYYQESSIINSLHLGVENAYKNISYLNGVQVPFYDDPILAFNAVKNEANANIENVQNISAPLAYNLEELNKLKMQLLESDSQNTTNNNTNNNHQINRIESFENAIQQKLDTANNTPGLNCLNTKQETYGWDLDVFNNFTKISDMHCDTIIEAFKCNITKVATLQLSEPSSESNINELNNTLYYMTQTGTQNYVRSIRYTNERISYLIDQLKSNYDENGEALLESTLVFKVTDFGDGDTHNNTHAPFLMVAGNNIFDGARNVKAKDNFELLDSITTALGLENTIALYGSTIVEDLFK